MSSYDFLNRPLVVNPFIHTIEEQNKFLLFDSSIPRFYNASFLCIRIIEFLRSGNDSINIEYLCKHLKKPIDALIRLIQKMNNYDIVKFSDEELKINSPIIGETKKPKIDTIFLIVSDYCNYLCKYCHIMHNKTDSENRNMTITQLHNYLTYFDKVSCYSESKRNIVFFGGEPLLNFDVIENAVMFWPEKTNIEYTLFTNCSLVTEAIAKKLAMWKVKVIASIDGIDEYDTARTDANGSPTYNRTIAGYRILQQQGCVVGISCTVGGHNVHSLPTICSRMINELAPVNIGFNILHDVVGKSGQSIGEIRLTNKKMIEAYKVCSEAGVYFVQAINRLRPIVDEHPRVQDCGAYGRQIVVTPSGSIGPCEVFSTSGRYFGRFNNSIDVRDDVEFNHWANRFPIRFPECKGCHAIALCGGGCAYDSVLHFGDINHKDIRCCEQAFAFFDFAKDYIVNELYVTVGDYEIVPVSREGLRHLYGNIDVYSERYPLTTYHKLLNIDKGNF
jgi:uncharacterized protein